ncbi:hypothetical protein ONS95_000766 [Cadophora gregata]|uniref:uncharacterized protein n=1 Tax=Cadophora gregata TaxID=51156 RepID=UPI0026DBACEB|nr:uncharacterized protein ONS95_000766 [Cadophora gregata]KAK0128816.1 hypothetical protein ONS95_000766 [Cadophora gregata]
MAISDAVQTLSAAFAFGILLQAATGALFIYYRGHGSTIFQDGRRLVLILFLLFAALWAQIQFLNLLLADTMATACQATLIISTMFDQLARVGIEQFLMWSIGHGTKLTAERLILQGILLLRVVGGGVLVGFTRPQFKPVCVAQTMISPLAVVVLAVDAIIIGVLMVRAMSLGMSKEMREKSSSTRQEQSKALIFTIIGLAIWTATSVPMILGVPTIILMVRTVVPANGLLILVGIVTMFPGALLLAREENGTTPEARSPFVTPAPPRELFGDNVPNNGSPVSTNNTFTKNGSLFVVNPSTPHDSPTAVFQSSFRRDTRGFTKLGNEIDVHEIDDNPVERPDRIGVKGPGYRGSSGVFPSMVAASQTGVQAALAPQIRPAVPAKPQQSATFLAPAAQQKRSMFNWGKSAPAKPNIRALGISNPVSLDVDGAAAQPFAKIQTIDLATAASMERERREEASARAKLVANRPAPQPPQFLTQEALRRSVSVKRKEMPPLPKEATPTVPVPSISGISVVATNGTSSSASLSPAREEVRRRSPRQANSFDQTFNEKTVQPILQRKRTVGLPSNPRSTRITMAHEAAMAKPQTVMLMNDVVYDNPGLVKTIIQEAPSIYAAAQKKDFEKSAFSETTVSLKSANSVIHRPRPYKRDKQDDRALFPSEPSPGHRRSRSGSSITPRKSFLTSQPGSPTLLPRLPPLPQRPITSAAGLKRLLPNDTKSMTFDEKIELLFPAPPGSTSRHSRRSSVPSLPRLPSVYMAETPMIQSPVEEGLQSRRASKRTTIASFAIPETNLRPRSPKRQTTRPEESEVYRFSANTYRSIADEVGEMWIPGIADENVDTRNSLVKDPERQSVLGDMRKSHWTEASDESSQEDATTYWGSVHSEVPQIDLAKARQNANSLYIQRPDARQQRNSSQNVPSLPQPDYDLRRCEAFVPLMLDAEAQRGSFLFNADDNRKSFLLDADQSLPGDKTPSVVKNENGWHHRIGDELPTFSERSHSRSRSNGRKMPPPTPLLLNKTGKKATVVVHPSEISPPTDSPERAIADIQAQLKRFEDEPSRGSVGSLLRRIPGTETEAAPDSGHFRLLENLEKEMGQQETHWQRMQTNLDRDSMSQAMSPYTQAQSEDSEGTLTRESSQRSIRTPSKILARRARVRSSMTVSERTTSTQSSDNSRASIWQQRLAEAQMEYMDNAPALLRKKSLNFLSVSKGQATITSPTPPESVKSETDLETESESDSDTEAMMKYQAPQVQAKKAKAQLWQPSLPSPKAASGRLWNFPYDTPSTEAVAQPPARDVRPAQRRLVASLSISTKNLWSKPRSSPHSIPVVGLWGSKPVRPRSITTRPLTQRPQRKSRRITFLPDIVESPVPLPNKRDTLGIFQFPWGETSDQPTYQPAFNPAMISGSVGPALAPNLDARSKELEPDFPEYSSSFFDDYEEEDEDLDIESDDDFDETTLWEIADLLNSRDVPSKDSLLPQPRSIIDDYDIGSDPESPDAAAPPPVSRLPIQPLAVKTRPVPQLWAGDVSPPVESAARGLPQPESAVWNALVTAKDDTVRSKPRSTLSMPELSSTDLWTVPEAETSLTHASFMWSSDAAADISSVSTSASVSEVSSPTLMWSPQALVSNERASGMFTIPSEVIRSTNASPAAIEMVKAARPSAGGPLTISSKNMWTRLQDFEEADSWISKSSFPRHVQPKNVSSLMWTSATKTSDVVVLGLFDASTLRSDYRSTEAMPAAINMICKPRTLSTPLTKLTSTKLWTCGQDKFPVEHHWITESSIRPDSPTYSVTSSGESSPISDSSSVKSTSTKASSIWSASVSAIPSWWDRKAKKPSAPSPVEDSKHPSKLPVRQAPTPLVPVRESRVLASRDLWESRAPVLENTPAKKGRRGTMVQQTAIPVLKAAPSQYRRPVAVNADWADALAEAVAAGRVKKTSTRPVTSEADWESALSEAVALSKPRFQRSVSSESDWESALAEAVSQSTPRLQRPAYSQAKWEAALDEAIIASTTMLSYDPAVLHPVFFTSSLISSVSDIHPAAMGYFTQKSAQPAMWMPTSEPTTRKETMLWSKNTIVPRNTPVEMKLSGEPVRKAPVARQVELPVLESNSFWQSSQIVPTQRDWLAPTSKTSLLWSKSDASATPMMKLSGEARRTTPVVRNIELPILESSSFWQPSQVKPTQKNWLATSVNNTPSAQTWTPSVVSHVVDATESNTMWTAKKESSASKPDIFKHAKGAHIRQTSPARPATLPRLNSNELFDFSITATQKAQTNWLHSTSAAAPAPKSLTWTTPTAQSTEPDTQKFGMWQPQSTATLTSPALFTNPHSQPWVRTKRTDEALGLTGTEIESSDLWRPSMALPESPKNWLVKKRFSRVEFRY